MTGEDSVLRPIDVGANVAAINQAADFFINRFGPSFTGTETPHIQTDIAGAGAIAGLLFLRAFAPLNSGVRPMFPASGLK